MLRKIKQELKEGKTLLQFGFLRATGQALGMIAPLVIAKFFADALTKDAAEKLYGSYSLAKMTVFFFSTLLIASCQTPFIVFANQERGQTGKINKTFSVQLSFFLLGFFIFFAVTLPFSKYIAALAKISRVDLLFVLPAFVGLALKSFTGNLFMAMGQRIKNSLAELVFGFLTISLVFVLYWTGTMNLRTVFLVYPISGLSVALIFLWAVDINQLRPLHIDKQHFKEMLNFTKWLMLGAGAVYFINWGGNLVLRLFTSIGGVSMGDIGTYNVGYQIFKGIVMLTFIINSYFLPFVSQHVEDPAKMKSYLFNKRPKILLLGLIVIGLIFVVAPYLFKLFFGEVFQDSVTVLRILLVGSVLLFYSVFYETVLVAMKKYKFTQAVYILQVLLSMLFALLLVPVMGMVGVVVATVIAYFFRAATMEIYFRVKLKKLLKL